MTPVIRRWLCIALTMLCSSPALAARVGDDSARECVEHAKRLGPESSENYLVRYFIPPSAPCKDKASLAAFCAFAQSYDGFKTLAEDAALLPDPSDPDYKHMTGVRDRAARLCGTSTEAIRAGLCSKADASKQWRYAYDECPVEGRRIYMRECLKPRVLVGEGGGRTVQDTEAQCAAKYTTRAKGG